jgi:hypothetical protein
MSRLLRFLSVAALAATATPAFAQDGAIVYRLGKDTVAVERWARTPTRFSGEMVTRSGAAVVRTSYDLTIAGGRVTAATIKRMQPDGKPVAAGPTEVRLTLGADSATRTIVTGDSSQTRAFRVANAFPSLPVFVYAPYVLLAEMGAGKRDSVPAIALAGNNVGYLGLEQMAADTLRLRGAPYAMLLTFRGGRIQSQDGSYTTNKSIGTVVPAATVNVAAIAGAMKPTGVLSPRMTAYAGFAQGPITVNYGSPAVRGRTVWGGTLIPFDTVWRTGANEATHLATSKTMLLGDMTLAPGLYTLWIQHTRSGTWLIVNKQVGQWGTAYNAANDIGRVAMTLAKAPDHVEDFTITVRALGGPRGALEFAWGDQMAAAPFTIRP